MATADQVNALLDAGHSYASAARELRIAPGLVYMIATGVPADGSDDPHVDERGGRRGTEPGAQTLVNAVQFNPTHKPRVADWVRGRAAAELTPSDNG